MVNWIKEQLHPAPLTLSNGKVVTPKRSAMVFIVPILVVLILWAMDITRFNFYTLFRRGGQFFVMIGRMIPPDWSFFPSIINPLIETIMMSITGTLVGAALALPLAFLSSDNIIRNKVFLWVNRLFFSILRTLPILVFALLFKYIFGIGAFAGTMAIGVFTFTIMTKMFYELIDTADMGPFEALESSGASRIQAFWVAIMPQLWGQYFSLILYNFEMNIRNAAVLGYVGAGGIGLILNERLGWRIYPDVGLILLTMMVTVYLIESLSRTVRKKLL